MSNKGLFHNIYEGMQEIWDGTRLHRSKDIEGPHRDDSCKYKREWVSYNLI